MALVSFEAQKMIEKTNSSMLHSLRVGAQKRLGAELNDLVGAIFVLHHLSSNFGLVEIGQELETCQVVVVHDPAFLGVVLQVLAEHVLDNAEVNQLPVLVEDVLSLSLLQDNQSQ